MVTRNVVLTETQDYLVQALVASGRYQNVSEAMRAGLRLLEQEEAQLAGIRRVFLKAWRRPRRAILRRVVAKMRSAEPLRLRALVHEPILPAYASCGSQPHRDREMDDREFWAAPGGALRGRIAQPV